MTFKTRLRSWWTLLWKSLLFLVLWGLLLAPPALLIGEGLEPGGDELSWLSRLSFDLAGLLAILVALWVMLRWVERRPFVSLGLAPGALARDGALGVALAGVMVLLSIGLLWAGGWAAPVPSPDVSPGPLLLAGLSMLLNAALQELLFRSYLFQTIRRHASVAAAVLVTSLVFVLAHGGAIGGSPLAALNLFAAGVLLAAAYQVSGNLWLPIALHFVWNLSIGPILGLSVSGRSLDAGHRLFELSGPERWTGGAFGVEASLAATLATAAALGLLLLGSKRGWWKRAPTG